jgi:tRNA-modifying protein YgfZ
VTTETRTAEGADDAARSACAVRWLDGMGTLSVSGPDRATWLNGLVTCDARRVQRGQAGWGLALNRTGKIQSVVFILAREDSLLVGAAPATAATLFPEFERMLVMEDAELKDVSDEVSWAWLIGPASEARAWSASTAHAPFDLLGLGAVIAADRRDVLQASVLDMPELGDEAWLRLRLERDLVLWGQEFDQSDRPHEAGLERRAVDWQKGCYLGQEVVCMQDMRGKVSRRVGRLWVDGTPAAESSPVGLPIHHESDPKPLGHVKSAAYSERAGGWLAFAMLPVPVPQSGLVVGDLAAARKATLVDTTY